MKSAIAIGAIIITGGLSYILWPALDEVDPPVLEESQTHAALVEVQVPDGLSQNAQIGKQAFDAICASCHGENAGGQDGVAPPLVHKIYEPSHHGDESFHRAASMGVSSHHWPFGDMPPIEGNTRGDIVMIIAYIRELQRANGIH
jgi:cytochrome c